MDTGGRPVSRRFIAGGVNGVVLHAPKGLFVAGDTLWVTDIDVVRAFSTRTGAPLVTVDLARLGARFLNDVARSPEGALYITDTGLHIGLDRLRGRLLVPLLDAGRVEVWQLPSRR